MNQNQILDSLPFCQAHKPNRYQFFDLKRDKLKFICGTCLYCNQDQSEKVDFSSVLDLSIGFKYPSEIPMKLINDKYVKNCLLSIYQLSDTQLTQQFNQWEQQFRLLQMTIDTTIKNQKEQLTLILNSRKELQDNISKHDFFKNLVKQLNVQNEQIKDDVLQQIENKLGGYITELTNDDSKILQSKFQKILGTYHMQFVKFKTPCLQVVEEQLKNMKQQHVDFQEKISKQFLPFSQIINDNYFNFLTTTVEERTKRQFSSLEQIYSVSKNGFNFNLLNSTISGKENLLFLFQSHNKNAIFGGFTPCRWELGKFSVDNQLSSFLFSYNLSQIYPLKGTNKQWTAYHDQNILLFGGTWNRDEDLLIQSNFADGFSKLGKSYQAEGKNGTVQSEDLFGGWKPNLRHIEIYKFQ